MGRILKQKSKRILWVLSVIVLLSMILAGVAIASSGGPYTLNWLTIDGGGGRSTGGDYVVSGTIGQPDAGEMIGGDYAISGGFWGHLVGWLYKLFLPQIMR